MIQMFVSLLEKTSDSKIGAETASSKFCNASLSETSNSSGNSGNGGSQCGLICCTAFSNAEYCTLGNRLSEIVCRRVIRHSVELLPQYLVDTHFLS